MIPLFPGLAVSDPPSFAYARDLPSEEFRRLAHEVVEWTADYLTGVDELPGFPTLEPGEIRSALPAVPPYYG